jgi:catechol 2,3-dioxygenase-like lactoylglutathione lyase family enzyme
MNRITRREAGKRLAILAASSCAAQAEGFQNTTLHHVSLQVGDLTRSSEFYARAFGCMIQKRDDGAILLSLGKGHIILRRADPPAIVDHFAIGVDGFDSAMVKQALKSRGAAPADDPIAGLSFKDVNGFQVQVTSNATYLGAPTSFAGTSLDHASIHTSNMERSADFYSRVFGCVASKPDQTVHLSIGKSHISLNNGKPPGQVDHFAVGFNPFNPDEVIRELMAHRVMTVNGGGFGLHVVDPDGYPVQLIASSV